MSTEADRFSYSRSFSDWSQQYSSLGYSNNPAIALEQYRAQYGYEYERISRINAGRQRLGDFLLNMKRGLYDNGVLEHGLTLLEAGAGGNGLSTLARETTLTKRVGSYFQNVNVAKGGITAYETALAGGKHSGFLKNYLGRSADEITKGIRSMQSGKQGISVHLDKIANPSKYVPNWSTLRPGHQQSLINGWQNTVTKHTEQIQILQTILGKTK